MKGQPDHFYRRAKEEGFEARSVYKLSEVDGRRRMLRAGQRVLDLGASPGSWGRYALERIGPGGYLLAVDIAPLRGTLPAHADYLNADALDPATAAAVAARGPFDVLLSDMAPKTIGVRFADHERSLELGRAALEVALLALRPGGSAFVKLFDGEGLATYRREFAARFRETSLEKPQASRSDSVEVFLLGLGHRGLGAATPPKGP